MAGTKQKYTEQPKLVNVMRHGVPPEPGTHNIVVRNSDASKRDELVAQNLLEPGFSLTTKFNIGTRIGFAAFLPSPIVTKLSRDCEIEYIEFVTKERLA